MKKNSRLQKLEAEFIERFNKLRKTTREEVTYRQEKLKWEKFVKNKNGDLLGIRCQALKNTEDTYVQCGRKVGKGRLFCVKHGKFIPKKVIEKRIQEYQQFGILHNFDSKALKKEIQEMQNLPKEEKEQLGSEILILLAFLRNILSTYSDKELREKPYLLTGRDGIISRLAELKEKQHNLLYSSKTVFPIERVEALFLKFKNILVEEIHDKNLLQKIADRFRIVGLEDREAHNK